MSPLTDGDPQTILVADDSPESRELLGEILATKGYRTISAADGQAAIEQFEIRRPDLVLLDLHMPRMGGFGVIQHIRSVPDGESVPIIIITGSEDLPTKLRGLDTGADDFVIKPVEPRELLSRIRAHLRAKQLTDELQTNLNQAQGFAEFGRLVNVLDRAALSNVLRSHLPGLLGADLFSLFVLDPAAGTLVRWTDNHPGEPLDDAVQPDGGGTMQVAVRTRTAVIVPDLARSGFTPHPDRAKYAHPGAAAFPLLLSDSQPVGVLNVNNLRSPELSWLQRLNVTRLCDHLAIVASNIQTHERVHEMSRRDSLTGLLNHGTFQQECETLFKSAKRYGRHLSLMMVDIDRFKFINDRYGHPAGDQVLKTVARIVREACRGADLACRYGGEEFAVAMPETARPGATAFAERVLEAIRREPFAIEGSTLTVRASAGVSSYLECGAETKMDLIHQADQALYEAKTAGRDQVRAYPLVRRT